MKMKRLLSILLCLCMLVSIFTMPAFADGEPPADPAGDPPADPPADPSGDPPAGDPPTDPAGDPPAGDPPADPSGDPPTGDPPTDPAGDPPAGDPPTDPAGDPPAGDPPIDPAGDPPAGDPPTDPSGDPIEPITDPIVYNLSDGGFQLSSTGHIYNDTGVEPGSINIPNNGTLTVNVDFGVTRPSGTMKDVGTYYFTIYGLGNYEGQSIALEYNVYPASLSLSATASPTVFVYDGTAKVPTFTLSVDVPYTVSYSDNVNAGTCTYTLSPAGGNYTFTPVSGTFVINKANPSYTTPAAIPGLSYNGYAQQLVSASTVVGGTMVYSLNGVDFGPALPSATASGTYTVSYMVIGDANHNNTPVQSLTVGISSSAAENVAKMIEGLFWLPGGQVDPGNEHQRRAVLNVWEAYQALPDSEKGKVPAGLFDWLYYLVSNTDYALIGGNGATWYKGKSSGIGFTAIDPWGKFAGVRVDGVLIDSSNYYYSAEADTCIVTLKPSYLTNLGFGKHSISICFWNGYAPGHFYIMEADGSPPTGDTANFPLWGSMMLLSVLGMSAAAAIMLKRRKNEE